MTTTQLLDPTDDDGRDWSPAVVVIAGYVSLTVVLLGLGFLLTHVLQHSVGRWDEQVNEHFARSRTGVVNSVTQFATAALNTVPVVSAAVLVSAFLVARRHVRAAGFLVLALLFEITVFLSVTFLVDRPRPDVHRLNSTPATSSFPSGHTAAATVFFVGIALIAAYCGARLFWRVLTRVLAILVPPLVGFSRVYRGLHHPTDVFVGALFGLGCLFVAAMAVRAIVSRREQKKARSATPFALERPDRRPIPA